MKKWLFVVLLSFGLAACGNTDNNAPHADESASTSDASCIDKSGASTTDANCFNESSAVMVEEGSDGHNAENSLDTVGVYLIQSSGLTASLNLHEKNQYEFEGKRNKDGKEESFKYAGEYKWLPDGTRIALGSEAKNVQFFVGENVVVYLGENPEGKNKYTQIQGNPELIKELD